MNLLSVLCLVTLGAPTWYQWDHLPPATQFSDLAVYLSVDASYAIDLATDTVTDLPMPLHPVNAPGTCFAGNVLLKVGGWEDHGWTAVISNKVEALDPDSGLWFDLPPMPLARSSPACVFSGNKLWVFGGDQDSIYSAPGQMFDGSWHTFPGIKTYKHGFGPYAKQFYLAQIGRSAITLETGRIGLVGGVTDGGRVDLFDPATKLWTVGTKLPEPVAYGRVIHGDVIYNAASGSFWSTEPPPPPPAPEPVPASSFASGFEAGSFAELFPLDLSAWHNTQEISGGTVSLDPMDPGQGSSSLRCSAPPYLGVTIPKADIERDLFHFQKGDSVYSSAMYFIESTGTCQDLYLWDLEDSSSPGMPGRRIYVRGGEVLASDGKDQTPIYAQTPGSEISVPVGRWFNLSVFLYLDETNGMLQVLQDGQQLFLATGPTIPSASSVLDQWQIGITANANMSSSIVVHVDEVSLEKS